MEPYLIRISCRGNLVAFLRFKGKKGLNLKNLISKLDFATQSKKGTNKIKSKKIKRQQRGRLEF